MSLEPSPNTEGEKPVVRKDWLSTLAWVVAAVTVVVAVVVVLQTFGVIPTFAEASTNGDQSANVSLPTYQSSFSSTALTRSVNPQTSKADLSNMEVAEYTVRKVTCFLVLPAITN